MHRILIVDDDRAIRRSLELHLQDRDLKLSAAATLAEAESAWELSRPDIVILDLMLPDGEGMSFLSAHGAEARVIMITGHQDMERAAEAMRLGAFDYLHKPLAVDEMDEVLARALRLLDEEGGEEHQISGATSEVGRIVGSSKAILELHKQIGLASRGGATVLLRGESGTGKELVARAIHRNLAPSEPFVAVNCSALVPTLLESELFGHEKGAFTGAGARRRGRLELAGKGILFLDEIGDLSLDLQAKLLRVLQERNFERVGSSAQLPFAATLIAATHRDLEKMTARGDFREDLYFRLRVLEVTVPPLRERREDIPLLVDHFLAVHTRASHLGPKRVTPEAVERLLSHTWPGNVRELENRVLAALLSSSGETLEIDVPPGVGDAAGSDSPPSSLREVEASHIAAVLEHTGWKLGETCRILGVSRPTLRKKITEYGLKESSSD